MINPMHLLEIKTQLEHLRRNHPKVLPFIQAVNSAGICDGAVIELRVTQPDGREYITNVRVSEDDLSCIRRLTELAKEAGGKQA